MLTMYKTVTRWNQSIPEAHISEWGKKNKSLWPAAKWFMGWHDSESVHILCQSWEGRTEQGALDSLQSLKSIRKELRALILSMLFYAS